MNAQLKALYELQKVDLRLAAARTALAALDAGAALRQQLTDYEKRLAALTDVLKKSETELKDSELNLKSVETKKQSFEQKLYTGQVMNPKELASMEKEIEILGKSRGKLDDRILELYEIVETQQADVKKAETIVAQLKERLSQQTAQYEAKSRELNSQIEQLTAERQKSLGAVTDRQILQRYEAVRARYKDSGLAEVQDGKCGGCHVGLTSFSIRKLREDAEYQTCESCGRILVMINKEKEQE